MIYGNSEAALMNNTSVRSNTAAVNGTIFLYGDGTNTNARVVSLVQAPTGNTYTLDTLANDSFDGHDVVRPGAVTVCGIPYSLSDASLYSKNFLHTSKAVHEGAFFYSALNDTSHDRHLILAGDLPTIIQFPQTGDSSSLPLWIGSSCACLALLLANRVSRKKAAKEQEKRRNRLQDPSASA